VSLACADGGHRRRAADVDALQDSDDVQNVYTNIDISDEARAAQDDE
jgi:transcriptional/translational regulatory protein YebC/TACO1